MKTGIRCPNCDELMVDDSGCMACEGCAYVVWLDTPAPERLVIEIDNHRNISAETGPKITLASVETLST